MPQPRRSTYVVALLGTLIAVLAGTATADAKSRPRVKFAFVPPAIETGQPIGIVYSVTHRPRGTRLELQRAVGTAGVWRRVKKLKLAQKAVVAPTAPQGLRRYRVALLGKHRRVRARATHSLRVYGPTALATVLSSSTETVQIGGSLFRYVSNADPLFNGGDYCAFSVDCSAGTPLPAFKITDSSCRSVSLQLATVSSDPAATPAIVSIVSEAADPTSVGVPLNGIATLTGLVQGDVEVDLAYQPVNSDSRLYLNGAADCYTANGSTAKPGSTDRLG